MVGSPCPGVSFCLGLTREEGVTGHSFGGVPTNLLHSGDGYHYSLGSLASPSQLASESWGFVYFARCAVDLGSPWVLLPIILLGSFLASLQGLTLMVQSGLTGEGA